jgi:hypothetical protein
MEYKTNVKPEKDEDDDDYAYEEYEEIPYPPDLLKELLVGTFKANRTNKESDSVQVINAFAEIMHLLGHERKVYMAGGKLDEIIKACQTGGQMNKSMNGPDILIKNGENIEVKTSNVELGNKVTIHLRPPTPKHGETNDQYYKRMKEATLAKGRMEIKHTYKTEEEPSGKIVTYSNDYHFSADFIAFYMTIVRVKAMVDPSVGGKACLKCTEVHKLRYLESLNKQFDDDKEQRDEAHWLHLFKATSKDCSSTFKKS